jgi:hypothetical protein
MSHNAKRIMAKHFSLNLISKLWKKIFLPFWMKSSIATWNWQKIAMVQVLGCGEDEKTFNNISFMENKLWNQLTTHQMTCILLWLAKNNSCCRISLWWSNCIVKGIDLEVLGKCVILICGAIYMLQKFVCEKWWFGCWIGIWMWGSWLLGARLPCCWSGQAVCGCIVGQFTVG